MNINNNNNNAWMGEGSANQIRNQGINSIPNYLDAASPPEEAPKIKFNELQNLIKKNQHNKKVRENMYNFPASINRILTLSHEIQRELEQKDKDHYYDRINVLYQLIKDAEDTLQFNRSAEFNEMYRSINGEYLTSRDKLKKCRKIWNDILCIVVFVIVL